MNDREEKVLSERRKRVAIGNEENVLGSMSPPFQNLFRQSRLIVTFTFEPIEETTIAFELVKFFPTHDVDLRRLLAQVVVFRSPGDWGGFQEVDGGIDVVRRRRVGVFDGGRGGNGYFSRDGRFFEVRVFGRESLHHT